LETGQKDGSSSLEGLLKEIHLLSPNSLSKGEFTNFTRYESIDHAKRNSSIFGDIHSESEADHSLLEKQTMKQIYKEEELVIP